MKKKAYIAELLAACAAKDKRILELEETLQEVIDICIAERMTPVREDRTYLCRINKDRVHFWSKILKGKSHARGD